MNVKDHTIPIPHHWSSEDALNVVQLLDGIISAIWHLHGDGMREILQCPSLRCPDAPDWDSLDPAPKDPEDPEDWPF